MTAGSRPGTRASTLALIAVAGLWGFSFVAVKGAVSAYPVVGFLFLRFLLGGVVLTGAALARSHSLESWWRVLKPDALLLGLVLAIAYLCQTVGLELGAAPAAAAVLTCLVVVITPGLEWATTGTAPGTRVAIGAAVALGGTALVCLGLPGAANSHPSTATLGFGLELIAAAAFAIQVFLVGRIGPSVPPITLGAWQLLVLAAVMAPALPFTGGLPSPSAMVLASVLFCGLGASAFGFAVQAAAQRRLSPIAAARILPIEPGIALVAGALAGEQELTPIALFGLSMLLGGVLVQGSTKARRFLAAAHHLVRLTRLAAAGGSG
jgi:drug/metabolite transporter (DMT)-like permease